jgi:hypothetical protein
MNSKKIRYIIIGVVVIAVLGVCIYLSMQNQGGKTGNSQPGAQNSNTQNAQTAVGTQTPAATSTTQSYASAIKTYAGRRIQFSFNSSNYCTMVPSINISFKNGTNIMLDNRSNKATTIYLDGQAYSLKAFGFKIVYLVTSAKLPHTVRVDCGSGKNNDSIILK